MEAHQLVKIIFHADLAADTINRVWYYYYLANNFQLESSSIPVRITDRTCTDMVLKPSTDLAVYERNPVYNPEVIPTSYLIYFALYITALIILVLHYFPTSGFVINSSYKDDKSMLHPIDSSTCSPLITDAQASDFDIEGPKSSPPKTIKKIIASTCSSMGPPKPSRSAHVPTTSIANPIESPSQLRSPVLTDRKIPSNTSILFNPPPQPKKSPTSQKITQTPTEASSLSSTQVPDGPTPESSIQEPRKESITEQEIKSSKVEPGTSSADIAGGQVSCAAIHRLLTGIRVSVSQIITVVDRKLTEQDFSTKNILVLDTSGNQVIKRGKYDFKFNDYSPLVFHHLRQLFKVDSEDYLKSLTSNVESDLKFSGKSSSSFYFSSDYRFIIKTIHCTERETLVQNLKHYYHHVKRNPDTLISQFYGLHSVKLSFGKEVNFIVMNNLFPASREIHRTFDLKGSTLGRRFVDGPSATNKKSVVYKDLDWIDQGETLKLGPLKRGQFLEQLKKDVELLQQLNIMDYSLLIGIHEAAAESKPKSTVAFRDDLGGFRSTDENDKCLAGVYYLGIIDCLTRYSSTKKAETVIKCVKYNRKAISSIPASHYGYRFYSFIESAITEESPQGQVTTKGTLNSEVSDNHADKEKNGLRSTGNKGFVNFRHNHITFKPSTQAEPMWASHKVDKSLSNHILKRKMHPCYGATFQKIRKIFKINEIQFLSCFDSSIAKTIEVERPRMFLSPGNEFIIRQISDSQVEALTKSLSVYMEHATKFPETLLCQYVALYKTSSSYYLIMKNRLSIYEAAKDHHISREQTSPSYSHRGPMKARFWRDDRKTLSSQLSADLSFLSQNDIMGYSLLIGKVVIALRRNKAQDYLELIDSFFST